MKKRFIALILTFAIVISFLPKFSITFAEDIDGINASSYINTFSAALSSKGISGKLTVTFQVTATHSMNSVGVLEIIVRNNNGMPINLISGSTSNGLLNTGTWIHSGSYTLNLTSGNTYYCTVVAIARDANGYDTRKITTQHVTCP